MRRRALLASLTALSGCSGLVDTTDPRQSPQTTAPDPTETPSRLPYRGGGPETEPHGFAVVNQTDRDRYVTVVVEHEDDTVFVDSTTVPASTDDPGRIVFSDLVASEGVYTVLVETADGSRTEQGWLVTEEAGRPLHVILRDDGVESFQLAYCRPDCPPISDGTAAVDTLPYRPAGSDEEWHPNEWRAGVWTGTVVLLNPGETTRRAGVRLSLGGDSLLDYRYDVPPGVQLAIPATTVPGTYDLQVTVAGVSAAYEWHLPEDDIVPIDITAEPAVTCSPGDVSRQPGVHIEQIRNFDTDAHSVTLRVTGDSGSREVTYDVGGEAETTIGAELRASDHLHLELELDTGARLTATWTLCPSASRTYAIGIDRDGTLGLLDRGKPVLTTDDDWDPGDESQNATWTSNATATAGSDAG